MKKKLLSLALALAMCLSLAVPALAAEPKTVDGCLVLEAGQTILALNGVTFTLSNPIAGRTTSGHVAEISEADVVHLVPAGTALTFNPSDEKLDELIYMEAMINQTTLEGGIVAGQWASAPLANVGTAEIDIMLDFRSTGDDHTHFIIRPATEEELKQLEKQPAGDKKEETPAETPAETEKPASAFTDVDPASPFAEAIQWAVDQKITNGKTATTFGPGDTCTRGQILTFLYRANGSPKPKAEAALGAYYSDWADIPASFAAAARWVNDEHLIRNGGSVFGAATPCTRGEAMTHLWAAAGRPSVSSSFIKKFTDMQGQSSELSDAVAWAVQHKITTGTTETTFSPDALCTRGQIVTFLYRAYGK